MVRFENINKKFGRLQVLKNINLLLLQNNITAIIGPNGSGKTTLIKSILGLIKADSGSIIVNGETLNGNWNYRKQIGYMPQIARFPENLSVKEVLYMIKDLRKNSGNLDEELYYQFRLEEELNKSVRALSGGTRQKLSAVLAFLFDPQILILDEPTAGLDPNASSKLKDKILKEKARGKTIILTSHIMSELEELSEQIVFLLEGQVHYNGSLKNIIASTNETKLERAIANIMEGSIR